METVRELRQAAGLTQAELARRIGMSQPNVAAYESGTRRPSPRTLDRIRSACAPRPTFVLDRHRSAIRALARANKAVDIKLFGSTARGEDVPGSDLDLLVEFAADASLRDHARLAAQLEELLGIAVDVVDAGGLRGPAGDRIAGEAVAV